MTEVHKLANSMRLMLHEFRQENKFFGNEFLYEDINLYEAFELIQFIIIEQVDNHKECIR